MRSIRLAVLAAVTASLAQPASAQINLGGDGFGKPVTREEVEKKEAQERAYRDSLKKIPDQKAVNDPWGGVRDAGATSGDGKSKAKR